MNIDLEIGLLDPSTSAGEETLRALVALEERRSPRDEPLDPAPREQETRAWLTQTWGGARRETWVGRTSGGPAGMVVITIFEADNTHAVELQVVVDPALRRRGLGTRLLGHTRERARTLGRRLLLAETSNETGAGFAAARGFTAGMRMPRRRLVLSELQPAQLSADLAEAWERAAGYELIEVSGAIPNELLEGVLALMDAMNDSPTEDLDVEDQVYDAERWRRREQNRVVRGQSVHLLLARHLESGELVGLTEVIDRDAGGSGFQGDTVVLKSHRGHRLGTILKLEMAGRLPRLAPRVSYLDTWNAASNAHMLAINEAMGYRIVGEAVEWQRGV